MSIESQAGYYIEHCNGIIDEMVRDVALDENESNLPRLKKAFQNIHNRFFTNPDAFKFDSTVAMPLKKDSPDVYEQLNSLVEILQGRSEMMPLPALTFDGAGVAQSMSLEDQAAIRSELCAGVALKINTAVLELSTKRKELAAEASDISESKQTRKATRPDFEAQIAAARARQELRATEAGCIQLVTENGLDLEHLDPIFQNNKNVVLAAVIQNGRALQFAHPRLRNDNDVVREALKHPDSDFIIEHAGDAFRENRAQLLEAIRNNEMAIGYGNTELVEDRQFMLDAIDVNPMVIQLFDESLRNNREIVIRALESMDEIDDPEILLRVVGNEIRPFAEAYCRVLRNSMDLEHLDQMFRNDRDIVLAAVRQNGYMLRYASDDLKNNPEIVLAAIRQNGYMLRYASDDLKNNRDIVLAAVSENIFVLEYANDALKNDRDIVLAALNNDDRALEYVGDEIHPFAEAYCRVLINPMDLEHLNEVFRSDKDIVLAAVSENIFALEYASEDLKNDPEIIAAAASKNIFALVYASKALKNNREFILAEISKNFYALVYASEALKNDKEFILAAVNENSAALEYASEDLKNDPEIIAAAQRS